jgi:hypothetical protein
MANPRRASTFVGDGQQSVVLDDLLDKPEPKRGVRIDVVAAPV